MSAFTDCGRLVDDYVRWLRSSISTREVGKACEITTPFLDRHNDFVQIYVQSDDGRYRLTDDGHTIRDLELSGVDLSSPRRSRLLEMILNGLGIRRQGDELVAETRLADFPQKQHALLQAILSVNDMFVLAKPMVSSLFHEDVERYLRSNRIRYTPNIQFVGHSKFMHTFDFVVPASSEAPERVIKAINQPKRDSVTSMLFSWNDTRRVRPEDSRAYVFLNDENRRVNGAMIDALEEYQIEAIPWSRRDHFVKDLAA